MAKADLIPTDALLDYLARVGARQDAVLERVQRETARMPRASMQVAPEQGALLELLARLIGAERILELGTFTGYSAICLARGLAPGGRLVCLEVDESYAEIARGNLDDAGVGDRVDIRVRPAEGAPRGPAGARPARLAARAGLRHGVHRRRQAGLPRLLRARAPTRAPRRA